MCVCGCVGVVVNTNRVIRLRLYASGSSDSRVNKDFGVQIVPGRPQRRDCSYLVVILLLLLLLYIQRAR